MERAQTEHLANLRRLAEETWAAAWSAARAAAGATWAALGLSFAICIMAACYRVVALEKRVSAAIGG